MDIRQLETFVAVASHLNFTRAAEELNLAQSSVSAQIRVLEQDLGVKLFDRLGRRVLLTDAGERLYGYARRMGEMTRESRAELKGEEDVEGSLRVRVPESLAELGRALKDGRISPKEAERCRKELFDLIRAAAELYSHLEPYMEAR